jgi:glycosyltransferase involved in cell wall biosynthesis
LIANNVDEFYDAIKQCITDEEFCRNIGLNARKLIEQQHDINVVTAKLFNVYEQLQPAVVS